MISKKTYKVLKIVRDNPNITVSEVNEIFKGKDSTHDDAYIHSIIGRDKFLFPLAAYSRTDTKLRITPSGEEHFEEYRNQKTAWAYIKNNWISIIALIVSIIALFIKKAP